MGCEEECEYLPSMRGKTRKRKADRIAEEQERARKEGGGGRKGSTGDGAGVEEDRSDHVFLASDSHRRLWERSKALSGGSGPRNSALWDSEQDELDDDSEPSRGRDKERSSIRGGASISPVASTSSTSRAELLNRRDSRPESKRKRSAAMDQLTSTLPLPGDTHNPLAVLVELSEVTPPLEVSDEGEEQSRQNGAEAGIVDEAVSASQSAAEGGKRKQSSGGQGEEDEYYAPIERTLKDEAPHIMSLINIHE